MICVPFVLCSRVVVLFVLPLFFFVSFPFICCLPSVFVCSCRFLFCFVLFVSYVLIIVFPLFVPLPCLLLGFVFFCLSCMLSLPSLLELLAFSMALAIFVVRVEFVIALRVFGLQHGTS